MSELLPPEVRPRVFAAIELFLDLNFITRDFVGGDLDSTAIYFCVAEATMRPLVLGKHPAETLRLVEPPESLRGSISRLQIADRTGLARETVRRKTNALVKTGLLTEASDGRVRTTRNLADTKVQKAAQDAQKAVERYRARLTELGGLEAAPQ